MNKFFKVAMLSSVAALTLGTVAQAQETVVWWDFLSGGDGVRMKALIERFNTEHEGEIVIQPTTLEWGTPFYTRVQTAAAIGEGPDVMTYHLSRVPLGVESGAIAQLDPADLESVGLTADTFAAANWEAGQIDGNQYAVPFDIHSIILYYNKDKLEEAGLLGEDGLPTGLDGADNFMAALEKLQPNSEYALSLQTSGDGTPWRVFYSLFNQAGGTFLGEDGTFFPDESIPAAVQTVETMASWVEGGYAPRLTEYEGSVALFTSGAAALHMNGVWEVPTMTDLAASGELGFEWGAIAIPTFFDQTATWADSHGFAIPNNAGREMTPEKKAAVLEVISWMNQNSLSWAEAGHIPAYAPTRESEEFRTMQPNATYSVLADTAVFDPKSVLAGVASPVYDAVANYISPAMNGEMSADEAIEEMKADLQDQAD
ncbi:multiple sugar transport system substrate-binding protein [Devosia crocina]|uniref:Multiple sugar transport system substrate-binding protein n=1 Tax=Devosia crocina TaxID=429728 RepID=A0A1I7N2B6_9HYPH|nr:extracellular solute-binding protein [Devosia crocina]SFV28814.1 multiple sugar transport system substrate-binding protein [Devosia crocina]